MPPDTITKLLLALFCLALGVVQFYLGAALMSAGTFDRLMDKRMRTQSHRQTVGRANSAQSHQRTGVTKKEEAQIRREKMNAREVYERCRHFLRTRGLR